MVMRQEDRQRSDDTERYKNTGLDPAFLADMAKVIDVLRASGYEPFDQLTGYLRTGNERYITRRDNARELVKGMSQKDIRVFLKHCKERK